MLSGDCEEEAAFSAARPRRLKSSQFSSAVTTAQPSARRVFEQLAKQTGGLYFYKPSGTVQDYTDILRRIFETAVKPPPVIPIGAPDTGGGSTTAPPNIGLVAAGFLAFFAAATIGVLSRRLSRLRS